MRAAVLLLSALAGLAAAGGEAAGGASDCEAALNNLIACDNSFLSAGLEPNPMCCGAVSSLLTSCGGLKNVMVQWAGLTDNFADYTMVVSGRVQQYIGRCPGPNASEGTCIAALQGVTSCVNASLASFGGFYDPNMSNLPPTPAMLQHVSSQCCPSLIAGSAMSVDLACLSFDSTMEGYFQPPGPTGILYFPGTMAFLGFQNTSYMGAPHHASWGANPMVINGSSTTPAQLMVAAQHAWPGPGPFPAGLSFHCANSAAGMGCYRWRVQYPPNSAFLESLQLVTAPATLSADGMTVMAPPPQGISVMMEAYYGALDMPRQLALFLLTGNTMSSMPVFPLPNECRRFPEDMCDAIVNRTMRCLASHYSFDATGQAPRLPFDPYCGGHIAELVPDVCSGYPWRSKAREAQNAMTLPPLLVERFMRAVETARSSSSGSHGDAPCNATVPSLKYTSDGTLLTSHCAASPLEGFVCVDPATAQFVSPSTGIPYYVVSTEMHDTSKYRPMSADTCHGNFDTNSTSTMPGPNN